MATTAPLDYLALNAGRRIQYREEHRVSAQDWYNSFNPNITVVGDLTRPDIEQLFDINKTVFNRAVRRGLFKEADTDKTRGGKKRRGKRYTAESVNTALQREAYLIPVSEFYSAIESGNFYIPRGKFEAQFRDYFELGVVERSPCVSVANAAKIMNQLQKRKIMVEDWPTFEDLSRESGLNLGASPARKRYLRMEQEGELTTVFVGQYKPDGSRNGKVKKMSPQEYERILARERGFVHTLQTMVPVTQLARRMGVTVDDVSTRVRTAGALGILHPVLLTNIPRALGYNQCAKLWMLTPDEADQLAQGTVTIPRPKDLENRVLLSSSGTSLDALPPLAEISPAVERSLWRRVQNNETGAFGMLMHLYQPAIDRIVARGVYGILREDLPAATITALYEAVLEANHITSREDLISSMSRKLGVRKKEEVHSDVSHSGGGEDGSGWSDQARADGSSALSKRKRPLIDRRNERDRTRRQYEKTRKVAV